MRQSWGRIWPDCSNLLTVSICRLFPSAGCFHLPAVSICRLFPSAGCFHLIGSPQPVGVQKSSESRTARISKTVVAGGVGAPQSQGLSLRYLRFSPREISLDRKRQAGGCKRENPAVGAFLSLTANPKLSQPSESARFQFQPPVMLRVLHTQALACHERQLCPKPV